MQVRELIEILLALPQEYDVRVNCALDLHENLAIRCVTKTRHNNTECVVIQDHFTHREAKVIQGYDGSMYEVPWK